MTVASQVESIDRNQKELVAALDEVRAALGTRSGSLRTQASPPMLDRLCSTFSLSAFERAILLLCAGMELDSGFAAVCAQANGDSARPYPTFGLALAALPAPHWSALTPVAPLRRWRLIEIASSQGTALVNAPLRIDEWVLHFLTGLDVSDERLAGLLEPVTAEELVPSHAAVASQVAGGWSILVHLTGIDSAAKRSIAAAAAAQAGLRLFALNADHVPAAPADLDNLLRLWEREVALTSAALYLDADAADVSDPRTTTQITHLLERVSGPVVLSALDRWRPLRRPVLALDVRKPTSEEQRVVWRGLLGSRAESLNGQVDTLVSQFNLGAHAIRTSVERAAGSGFEDQTLARRLWEQGRAQSRPRLENLAQRVDMSASWDDLVLPEPETLLLREIAAQVHHRMTVYYSWGFAAGMQGLGISALFAGSSGTGKTLAAVVLANSLELDLFRIDLSTVVSKYIGETEKNLRRVFDAGEDGGAILFFDEADALFGKRSEVKDSHDRYANIEINYLLQRMEAYRGLAVLATNMKSSLDAAFLRRLRFVVNFPFPDVAERTQIWRKIFPPSTPTADLDFARLARLNIPGGNIHNIALNAAFLAADAGEPVRMTHIHAAARREYAKIEKPLEVPF
jgi:hypothetical protein